MDVCGIINSEVYKVMLGKERILYLLDRLEKDNILNVKDIASELNISEATIRRDLAELEKQGKLKRIHGGAIQMDCDQILSEQREVKMKERFRIHYEEKRKVCSKASELVKDGECIFLDGGTSIVPMIDELQNRNIRIVTHNHLIVSKLKNPKAQIVVIGGDYISKYAMSAGPLAVNTLKQFQFDRCFIGCAGVDIDENCSYTAEVETRELKNIAMANSKYSYLLIDSSKIGVRGFCKFKSLDEFDKIYCEKAEKDIELLENFEIV